MMDSDSIYGKYIETFRLQPEIKQDSSYLLLEKASLTYEFSLGCNTKYQGFRLEILKPTGVDLLKIKL